MDLRSGVAGLLARPGAHRRGRREAHVGPAQLISSANDLVTRLIEEIRPGGSVREVAALGAQLRADAGTVDSATSETFPLLGHGNGLFWERPTIWLDVEENEERWSVLGRSDDGGGDVPPHPGVGTVGLEQNIIVHEGGNELLTPVPLEWW